MSNHPTPEELREAARKRAPEHPQEKVATPYGSSVTRRMAYAGGPLGTRSVTHSEKLPVVRITTEMAAEVAEFGNIHHMNTSDAVRTLIKFGLNTWKATNHE